MSWGRACWLTVRNLWKLFIYPETLEDCSQCLGRFCCLWMFWIVAGLSCGQIGKVNSRLSPLLARTGEKAIVFCLFACFLPEAWACRRVKLRSILLMPPKISDVHDSCFCVPGLCFPDHTPGSQSRLPPLLLEGIPSPRPHQSPFLLRPGLSATHSSSTQAPLANRVRTIQSVFSNSESRWGPALGHESPSEMVWFRADFWTV